MPLRNISRKVRACTRNGQCILTNAANPAPHATGGESSPALSTSPRYCVRCASALLPEHKFCPICGAAQPVAAEPSESEEAMLRRRLGGTVWTAPTEERAATSNPIFGTAMPPTHNPARKRKRRKKRWFKRPRVVVPLLLALIVVGVAGAVTYQARSVVDSVQEVSQIPPRITDSTAEDVPITGDPSTGTTTITEPATSSPIEFDTAPAQEALREAGVLPEADEGGVFGSFKDAAGDVSDLASGAAVAAGVKDPSKDAITILVMGVDARPGSAIDIGVRPDAIMVLHLDPVAGTCNGLAVPRDAYVTLPGYGQTKINHALMLGGVPYQRLVTEQFLGLKIDHYALIDFNGFKELVDAVGGVPITVPEQIDYNGTTLFQAGPQTFDGTQALMYARYRGEDDRDVGRVRRQQQLIRALISVAGSRSIASDVNGLLPALKEHIRTDLSPADLVALGDAYRADCGEGALALDVLQGDVIDPGTPDPIYQSNLTYVEIDQAVIDDKRATLLSN